MGEVFHTWLVESQRQSLWIQRANCTRGCSTSACLLEGPTSALPGPWVRPCLLLSSPADGHEESPAKCCDEHLTPVPWDGPRAGMDESLHTLMFNFRSAARLFSRMTVSVCTSSGGSSGVPISLPLPQHLVLSSVSGWMLLVAQACQATVMLFSALPINVS